MLKFGHRKSGVVKKHTPAAEVKIANFSGFGSGSGHMPSPGGGGITPPGGGMFGGGHTGSSAQVWNPVIHMMDQESIINVWMSRSPERLHRVWREIFTEDMVAGPAVELYKDIPWSAFSLTGIDDPAILRFYQDALDAIDAVQLGPKITQEFLVQGKAIGLLIMDESKGYFTHCGIQNPDYIQVTPQILSGFTPKLDFRNSQQLQEVLTSKDPRDKEIQQLLRRFGERVKNKDSIPIEPSESFYVARQASAYDSIGCSIYSRILHLVAYERALINSTITIANRRVSRLRHVVMGKDNWEPIPEEMNEIIDLFMDAERDPVGAMVGTRDGITVNEVGGNTLSDVIKLSDEGDWLVKSKLNAIGVSETFLSGEASYNSMEQVLGVFLDRVRSHREYITAAVFINQILKPLAKRHGFVKTNQARLAHRIRVAGASDADLILPGFVYEKKLRPTGDKEFLDILGTMEEKGIPISIRTWAACGALDLETEIEQMDEDLELRRKFAKQKADIAAIEEGVSTDDDMSGDLGGGDDEEDSALEGLEADSEAPVADEPVEEEPAEAPEDVEVGASASFYKEKALNTINKMPHIQTEFLGVTKEMAMHHASKVFDFLSGRKVKKITSKSFEQILNTGNKDRNSILTYILARAGVLSNVKLTPGIAKDITPVLCAKITNPEVLAVEILAVQAMTSLSTSTLSAQTGPRKYRSTKEERRLLTGYVPPDVEKLMTTVK